MKCPTCGRAIAWSAEFPERPFCSERCRLIDLGAWLSGDRAIPGEPVDPDALPDGGAGPTDPPANTGSAPHRERGR